MEIIKRIIYYIGLYKVVRYNAVSAGSQTKTSLGFTNSGSLTQMMKKFRNQTGEGETIKRSTTSRSHFHP